MTKINSNLIPILGGINLLVCVVLDTSSVILFVSVAIWILLMFLLYSFEYTLICLVLIRPSVDILGYISVPDFPFLNLGSGIAILNIILSGLYIYQNRNSIKLSKIPLFKLFFLLLSIYFIFSFTGISLAVGLQETIRVVSFIILYFVGWVYVNHQDRFFNLIRLVVYSSIIPLIVAYIEYFSGSGLYTNPGFENRIAGTFGHPNVLAYFSVIVLALIGAVWFYRGSNINDIERKIFITIGIAYLIVLLITFTRGAWLGLILFILLMSLAQYPVKTIRISSIIVGFATLISLLYTFIASPDMLDLPPLGQFPVMNRIVGLFNSDPSDSVIWRLNMWDDAYNKALESPYIGFGTGSSETIIEQTRGTYRGSVEVHNDYIKVFLEQGIIGLLVYLIVIINILYSLYSRYIQSRNIYILTIAVLMSIIYIVSLWDNLLRGTVLMWILFLLLGGVMRYHYLHTQQNN